MKKLTLTSLIFMAVLFITECAWARDIPHMMSIETALQTPAAKEKLSHTIKFYFGSQQPAGIVKRLGTDVSNRKTNAFGKSDLEVCNWVFLSALLSLQERAEKLGANAVINIESYYKKRPMSSATQFECHTGAIMAGVALKGEFVRI